METYSCEQIYDIIENEILTLKIEPGEVLNENMLCNRFSVSRTPVRTVLQRLQENGLLEIRPYKGAFVKLLNFDIINQLIYQRVAVESMILKDFIMIATPADIERVRFSFEKIEQYAKDENCNIKKFSELDSEMHKIWFKSMRKMYLFDTLQNDKTDYLRFRMMDIYRYESITEIVEEHRKILETIENADIDNIVPLIRQHLYGNIRRMGKDIFTVYAHYFSDLNKAEQE